MAEKVFYRACCARSVTATVLVAWLCILPLRATAADNLFLTGIDVTSASSGYLYAGVLVPLGDSNLGHGYVVHLWADYLEYSYDAAATEINAKANSLAASLAWHESGDAYWWNAKAGVSVGDTRLSPDDPGNDSRGQVTELRLGLAGERRLSASMKINGMLDYGVRRQSYWTRGRLLWHIEDSMYHGPEIVIQGDPSYDVQQYGWVLDGIEINASTFFSVKAGVRRDGDKDSRYAGIDLLVFF